MPTDLLLWSIPPFILLVAMLGIRRYSQLNLLRQVAGAVLVLGTLGVSTRVPVEPPVLIFLGAIGGTLIGQAYEAEKRRAAERRRAVGLDEDGVALATRG
ncbi:MAG: hypothetical protein ACAH65_10125 [Chloroflexota bacterium]